MTFASVLFLINLTCTLVMCGAIWLAQLSTYPLMAYVGAAQYAQYESEHVRRISLIAWTVITMELVSGALLLAVRPGQISLLSAGVGFVMILGIWLSTWVVQYPIHKKLSAGFDALLHAKLVRSNWQRTALWTMRGMLMVWMLTRMIVI